MNKEELEKKFNDFLRNVLDEIEEDEELIKMLSEDEDLYYLLLNNIESMIWVIEDKVLELKGLKMIRATEKVPIDEEYKVTIERRYA